MQIQQLKVALSELDNVKTNKYDSWIRQTTYTKKANVFFLEKRDGIVKSKKSKALSFWYTDELKEKEKKRHNVGLDLRSPS
ncbi:hypothetical protein P3T76_000532 [Phytophthora citrophthora]|uniref:Uncharacterized protein n=1 Tax=Phytophthora citrophthora TaxID=4793 RepID=A0AAD9H0V1_9STRA|nr:hypothetical protein P3T76_000532 [Phytophthora citrophthora]